MTNDELNRAIAEKVMGWRARGNAWWIDEKQPTRYTVWNDGSHPAMEGMWNPCGKWEHFGLVLGRVWELERYVNLELMGFKGGKLWALWRNAKRKGGEAEGTNPLEVACRAILEAWGDD